MGAQLLLIPALFVAICISFIILHSCYHRWKMSGILKRKRDAAKISLVNILQVTNATLITPAWYTKGAAKSNIRPTVLVSDETSSKESSSDKEKSELSSLSAFNPRNPNVLSSVLVMNDQLGVPPPCYEDLYGPGGAVFTFKSLSPERDEPPPFAAQLQNARHTGSNTAAHLAADIGDSGGQYQYSDIGNSPCLLQVLPQDTPVPREERRNSSAVLYL